MAGGKKRASAPSPNRPANPTVGWFGTVDKKTGKVNASYGNTSQGLRARDVTVVKASPPPRPKTAGRKKKAS